MTDELTPPDVYRCQARVPTAGPFALGGPVGDPRDGYRRRCDKPPTVVVEETKPGPDGLCGSMSLCPWCLKEFEGQIGLEGHKVLKLGAYVLRGSLELAQAGWTAMLLDGTSSETFHTPKRDAEIVLDHVGDHLGAAMVLTMIWNRDCYSHDAPMHTRAALHCIVEVHERRLRGR